MSTFERKMQDPEFKKKYEEYVKREEKKLWKTSKEKRHYAKWR